MVKLPSLKWPDAKTYRGWTFVLVLGVVLAVIALVDRGGPVSARADGSTGCQVEVTADELNVRAGPSQDAELLEQLRRGERLDATRIVTAGFRQLEDTRWVADQFVTPVAGPNCG